MSSDTVNALPAPFIHPTSIVGAKAAVGHGTRIWHFCHVMDGAVVGERCVLGQNVFVASGSTLGNGVKVQNNVSIYGGVHLEDDVFCGPSMVFTNVRNPRAHVDRKHAFESTVVGRGATLGANCTIVCGGRVGKYAMVAAGAVVTKPVPDYALVVGVPARIAGWVCSCGVRLSDAAELPTEVVCTACSASYRADHQRGCLVSE